MIELINRPDGWDLDMEILCSLPPIPYMVRIADLCEDFGLEHQRDVMNTIKRLRKRGCAIVTANRDNARHVGINWDSWHKAKTEGESYWQRVHGY